MKKVLISLALIAIYACNSGTFEQGKISYERYCASCHMDDGTGLKNIYPSLVGNERIWNDELNIPCLIRNGHQSNGLSADMPAYRKMKPSEISNILNFLRHTLNQKPSVNFKTVKKQLESCKQQN